MNDETDLVRLRDAVVARTGHHYYADKDRSLRERINRRMEAAGVETLADYLARLEDPDEGEAEWRALEDAITIGETYFFRYADHFQALRETVLPGLIARRKSERTLRIWSIGCANGAETYSVAILLRELLGDEVGDWRIALVGGDISEAALEAARRARYGQWALRTLGPEQLRRYFVQTEPRAWTLKTEYRSLARFERQNVLDLVSPAAPLQWTDYDLILCRNVLIYFSPELALSVAAALRTRLAPGGLLLLGHAEASLTAEAPIAPLLAPDEPFGLALRGDRLIALAPVPPPPAVEAVKPFVPPQSAAPRSVAPARSPAPVAFGSRDSGSQDLEALRRLADAGDYEPARALCSTLLASAPMVAAHHYWDALLRQATEDSSGAEAALRRALYLDRSFVLAHFRLGLLLLGQGRSREGRRALLAASRLAAALDPNVELLEGAGLTAGEFAAVARRQLDDLGAAA